jgi:putative FmdB family regulatory protein
MPTYEYYCVDDDTHVVEEKRSINDRDLPLTCACGSYMTRRLINKVGIQFKGSGFYSTDNGRKNG